MTYDEFRNTKKTGVVVFTEDSFSETHLSEKERSYRVIPHKYFPNLLATGSMYGDCLDGTDDGLNLDYYISEMGWKVEYCYLE